MFAISPEAKKLVTTARATPVFGTDNTVFNLSCEERSYFASFTSFELLRMRDIIAGFE